jgi:Tfp pilus assembly protein PilF
MGDLWIQVLPRSAADEKILSQDFRRKAHAEDLAAYTKLLRSDPDNPLRHDAVAALYLDVGKMDEAIAEFRQSLRLNNAAAPTHYNLGYALSARGRRDEAIAELEHALRIDPDYALAHNNLGALLQVSGRIDQARMHYERAIALRPDNVDARANLGQLLSNSGRPADALVQFTAVIALRPDHVQALTGLAWIRATASDPSLQHSDESVRLAEHAAALTRHRDLAALDALAAAYAAVARFPDAIRIAQIGRELATAAGQAAVAEEFLQRIDLYHKGLPLRVRPH